MTCAGRTMESQEGIGDDYIGQGWQLYFRNKRVRQSRAGKIQPDSVTTF